MFKLHIHIKYIKKIEASPKYTVKEKISLSVLINGPEAIAGSILKWYKIIGIIVPANVPIIKDKNSEPPTTKPNIALSCQR